MNSVLPITAFVAIAIFIIKETIEACRRGAANTRRIRALKKLLAAECERNKWSFDKLSEQIDAVKDAHKHNQSLDIEPMHSGMMRLTVSTPNSWNMSSPIWPVHRAVLAQHLFETASLDEKLFDRMEAMSVSLNDIAHVRDSFIENVTKDPSLLETFNDFAQLELREAQSNLSLLYHSCTGESSIPFRVR